MRSSQSAAIVAIVLSGWLSGVGLAADDSVPAPDNSAANKAVENAEQPTADTQSNRLTDVETAAKVRKAIVDDESLSTYAHNVKINVKDGVVRLSGPVGSAAEQRAVKKIAAGVVGAKRVQADVSIAK